MGSCINTIRYVSYTLVTLCCGIIAYAIANAIIVSTGDMSTALLNALMAIMLVVFLSLTCNRYIPIVKHQSWYTQDVSWFVTFAVMGIGYICGPIAYHFVL